MNHSAFVCTYAVYYVLANNQNFFGLVDGSVHIPMYDVCMTDDAISISFSPNCTKCHNRIYARNMDDFD